MCFLEIVFKTFCKINSRTLVSMSIFDKVAGCTPETSLKRGSETVVFLVMFLKLFRFFLIQILRTISSESAAYAEAACKIENLFLL